MKHVRLFILSVGISLFFGGLLSAQEQQAPKIYLETFEKCNNYARHYCLNGSHEASVNRALLDMKRKGYKITTKMIIGVARNTPSRMQNPVAHTTN